MHSLYSANQFMNPGPAPRPPTDRPRHIDLQRSQTTIPTHTFDTMSLGPSSPATSTPREPFFPNASTLSLSGGLKGSGQITVIKDGWVRCKEDKFLAGWNERFLILREFRLDFMKSENGKCMQSVQLNTVTGVSRSETTRMAFEITRIANPKDGAGKAILSRDLPTKTVTCEVRNDDEIYDWIDKIYERCPGMGGVSNPTNFSHRIHVGFDPQTGGFVGLPQEWEKLLTASKCLSSIPSTRRENRIQTSIRTQYLLLRPCSKTTSSSDFQGLVIVLLHPDQHHPPTPNVTIPINS
jgi:serine/threonine-protein kinase CLA4